MRHSRIVPIALPYNALSNLLGHNSNHAHTPHYRTPEKNYENFPLLTTYTYRQRDGQKNGRKLRDRDTVWWASVFTSGHVPRRNASAIISLAVGRQRSPRSIKASAKNAMRVRRRVSLIESFIIICIICSNQGNHLYSRQTFSQRCNCCWQLMLENIIFYVCLWPRHASAEKVEMHCVELYVLRVTSAGLCFTQLSLYVYVECELYWFAGKRDCSLGIRDNWMILNNGYF